MFPSSIFSSFFHNNVDDFFDPLSFVFQDQPIRNGFRVPRPPYTNSQFQEANVNQKGPVDLKRQQSVKKDKLQFTQQQGQYWCIEGDEAYDRGDYLKAIEYYNKAIELSEGSESTFFRCRAAAGKHLQRYEDALKDSIQAIELDDKNIKAHLLCGQILAEMGKNDLDTQRIHTAIVRLTKALTLCAGQKKEHYEKQLSKYIYRAKKLLYYKQNEIKNIHKRQAINNYKLQLEQQQLSPEQIKQQLTSFIDIVGDPDKQILLEIPEYLICRITMEIMENPVVTESGQCYERECLEEHFRKSGSIDPITRQPISRKYYPNVNVKKAIEEFLLKNPWSFEFIQGEDYRSIEF